MEDKKPPRRLKKQKHTQQDLFVIDALDVIIKDDIPSMEFPFYSLTKKPDREVRRYEYKDKWIEFRPSVKGLPTIYDKDLIIYAISQLVAAIEDGEDPPKDVEIDPYHFFVFTQRGTGGRDYEALRDSLDRLDGTRFRTNIVVSDSIMIDEWQGIIDKASLTTNAKSGKPEKLRITLSDMVMNTIKERAVLTLNNDYFRLKKPIERRIYELARKHVGLQKSWEILLENLQQKAGSRSRPKEFRRSIREIAETDHLPDYHIMFDSASDKVIFRPRESLLNAYRLNEEVEELEALNANDEGAPRIPTLETWVFEKARKVAPGMDVYALASDWGRMWLDRGAEDLDDHHAAFIGYCKHRYGNEKN